MLAVFGVVTVVAAAVILRSPLALAADAAFPARVAAVAGVALSAALAGLRRWHPFPRLGAANVLTGARTLVMSLLAGVALAPGAPGSTWLMVSIAAVGATADFFDGMLARRSGLGSRFGARFDMEVDALLVLVLSILVWRATGVGLWILAAGLLRYAFVVAGWALGYAYFVACVLINSSGLTPPVVQTSAATLSQWLLTIAIAGLGIRTSLKVMLDLGPRHLILVVAETLFLLLAALLAVRFAL